jgi:hypothetical protein
MSGATILDFDVPPTSPYSKTLYQLHEDVSEFLHEQAESIPDDEREVLQAAARSLGRLIEAEETFLDYLVADDGTIDPDDLGPITCGNSADHV